jgi:energy-coupling factor transporter ATP-binding protein EcfA2
MDIIKEISIKNFRSIKTLNRKIKSTHLNIFVGQNDQGKSNLLRALNLFFNNQTDNGIAFRFGDDYSYDAPSGRGSKIEIKVELLIHPPRNRFRQATPVIWTKIWKKDGSINETRKHPDGTTLQDRNNVSQWLNKLKYRYVPAIKGQDYFSTLMGELYDVLNTIHSDALAKQGEGFIGGIQNITSEITKDLDKQLGIPNSIQVPSDFKALFSNLDFGLRKNGNTYHLKQRGDGIKVRREPRKTHAC